MFLLTREEKQKVTVGTFAHCRSQCILTCSILEWSIACVVLRIMHQCQFAYVSAKLVALANNILYLLNKKVIQRTFGALREERRW